MSIKTIFDNRMKENRFGFAWPSLVFVGLCVWAIVWGYFDCGGWDGYGRYSPEIMVGLGVAGLISNWFTDCCKKTGWGKGRLWW